MNKPSAASISLSGELHLTAAEKELLKRLDPRYTERCWGWLLESRIEAGDESVYLAGFNDEKMRHDVKMARIILGMALA